MILTEQFPALILLPYQLAASDVSHYVKYTAASKSPVID